MNKTRVRVDVMPWLVLGALSCSLPAYGEETARQFSEYQEVIKKAANMVGDGEIQALAQQFGLHILNVTWEDTGRYKNSAVGPNISDMTLQIQQQDPHTGTYYLSAMPVIRYPNFSDKTGDISLDKFYLLVGNHKGQSLKRVTLREFLGNIREYLHNPSSWKGYGTSLLADRDTHVLVSAQACFLPIPKQGKAEFNPVLFNYQSHKGDPAVLAILITREGASVTVIDNTRDQFQAGRTWGQRLFFNQNGERASLTGQRISDFITAKKKAGYGSDEPKESEGLNMVMLIQVPLKQKHPMRFQTEGYLYSSATMDNMALQKALSTDVENAVIGHGKVEGPFTEIDNLEIERDPKYPIRVTVQFYKATSNGIVSEANMKEIAEQIEKVYDQADYVGSLVIGGDTNRPTEYIGDKAQPKDWWGVFWKRHEDNTGQSREDALEMWRRLFGIKPHPEERPDWGIINEPRK
jgi:hypothetical protein